MTKNEAIDAMKKGEKVTHRHFSDNEFITMKDGVIVDENGYRLNADEFWAYRTNNAFAEDWEIYKR